jgi:hypothetical protein
MSVGAGMAIIETLEMNSSPKCKPAAQRINPGGTRD